MASLESMFASNNIPSADQALGQLSMPSQSFSNVIRNPSKLLGTENLKFDVDQSTVTPSAGIQQADTPKSVNPTDPVMPLDTYRYGNGADDETFNPRTLGELEEKPENIASITLTVDVNGKSTDLVSKYSRFILQRADEAETEKYQVVETFSNFYTFFYGKRPSIYNYSGVLLNDSTHKWSNDMLFFYDNYFRGTAATELNGQTVIAYDGKIVSGFILNLNMSRNSEVERGMPFSMSVLVTSYDAKPYSADISSLITAKTAELLAIKQAISAQQAQLNKDVPGTELLFLKKVLKGKSNAIRTKKKGTIDAITNSGESTAAVNNQFNALGIK